jgi:hypothetical protein
MRAKTTAISVALCALFMFVFTTNVHAQLSNTLASQNNDVVRHGLTELMGEVRITEVAGVTISNTITITYVGTPLNNGFTPGSAPIAIHYAKLLPDGATGDVLTYAGGIELTRTGAYMATGVVLSSVNAATGQVVITVPAGINPNAGDYLAVNGARTSVVGKLPNDQIRARVSSTPSNANVFNQTEVVVATVQESIVLTVTAVTIPICLTPTNPSVIVTEGFAGTMVNYTTSTNGRPLYGASAHTRVRIRVNSPVTGVTLTWPGTVTDSSSSATLGTLQLESGSTNTSATYTFIPANQNTSDTAVERFVITPTVAVAATADSSGVPSTVQVQLAADVDDPSTAVIRFDHPYYNDPADNFITITKCITYLLYPFVTGNNIPGFTTGIAIANTSSDDAAFGGTGTGGNAQNGSITLYGWHNSNKDATGSSTTNYTPSTFTGAAVTAVVSANLNAGDTWANTIDGSAAAFVGFQGYVIAKCNFQFGHGFAFIVGKYNSGTVFDVAHGYLALVIPDPSFPVTAASNLRNAANGGESLGQ